MSRGNNLHALPELLLILFCVQDDNEEVLIRRAGQADADNLEKQRQRIRREREKVVRRLTSTKVVRNQGCIWQLRMLIAQTELAEILECRY
jgi:hypothetical protein